MAKQVQIPKPKVSVSEETMATIKRRAKENRRTISGETEYLIDIALLVEEESERRKGVEGGMK